jgi:hypothetical protein
MLHVFQSEQGHDGRVPAEKVAAVNVRRDDTGTLQMLFEPVLSPFYRVRTAAFRLA